MADIRAVLHQWIQDDGIDRLPAAQQKDLTLGLICLDYTEDKLAGILLLQEVLLGLFATGETPKAILNSSHFENMSSASGVTMDDGQ